MPEKVVTYQEMASALNTLAATAPSPAVEDLVSHDPAQEAMDCVSDPSFPKVLRRRLDQYFADQKLSPKANAMMAVKIAAGLVVLGGSWAAIYALRAGTGWFLALYILGGLAQTFLLLNIAHDSNHNAI